MCGRVLVRERESERIVFVTCSLRASEVAKVSEKINVNCAKRKYIN